MVDRSPTPVGLSRRHATALLLAGAAAAAGEAFAAPAPRRVPPDLPALRAAAIFAMDF